MGEKKELEWGQTPWDDWSREDLLKEVWRMWTAIERLRGLAYDTLFAQKYGMGIPLESPNEAVSPFWGNGGRGGAALEMTRQILEPIQEKYSSDNMYRSFFRYSGDLLFDKNGFSMIGSDWAVCPECGQMVGNWKYIGQNCSTVPFGKRDCIGTFRKLQWSDLLDVKQSSR